MRSAGLICMLDVAIYYKLYLLKLTMAVDNIMFRILMELLMFISISYVCVFVQYHQMATPAKAHP